MASFNRIIMIGNLTRDPELKSVGAGQVCRLGIAANHQYKNRQTNATVQEVCFIDAEVWGPQADACNQYLKKGKQVLVEGRLKLDSWTDAATGQGRSKIFILADRVVFLSQANDTVSSENNAFDENRGSFSGATEQKAEKITRTRAAKPAQSIDEAVFKDEQPFGDDLPF